MPWQIAISLSILASVIASIIRRRYSLISKAPSSIPPAVSYLLGVTPLGITVGLLLPHHIHWSWIIVLLFTVNSSLIAVANWLIFIGLKRLPIVQFQIINQFYEVVAIVLGWILLREGLSVFQVIGAVLLFVAAVMAIQAPVKNLNAIHRKLHFESVSIVLLAAITFGASLVVEKAALQRMDTGAYLIFGWGAQMLVMMLFALKDARGFAVRDFLKHELGWAAAAGWAIAVSGVFYVIALVNSNNISLMTALTAFSLPLVAFAAFVFLKERENQRLLWLGLIIGFVGLAVSSLH